jgi:hypothetical protein
MSYERDYAPIPPPVPAWRERLAQYWKLVRGDRPIGWLLLLWPTWWGLWVAAEGIPPLWILVVFTAGVWLTRSGGCVINDYADRWLDPQVERTRDRPLASGKVSGREALMVFAVLMLVFAVVQLGFVRLNWIRHKKVGDRKKIPFGPAIAGALIVTIMSGCLEGRMWFGANWLDRLRPSWYQLPGDRDLTIENLQRQLNR